MKLTIMIALYSIVALASVAILYGPLKRASGKEGKAGPGVIIPLILVLAAYAFPAIGALTSDGPVCWFFQKWGNIFLGYLLYFFGVLLIIRLVILIISLFKRSEVHNKWRPGKKAWSVILTLLLILSVSLNVGGSFTAHDVKTTYYELPKETLAQSEPFRMVLIGDLHIGVNSSPQIYRDMVERVNEQEADLVVIAGDLVTSSFGAMRDPKVYSDILSGIKSKLGTYVVYGNHDVDEPLLGGFTFAGAENALRNPNMEGWVNDCGWILLKDEYVRIPELNDLVLAGRRDETRPGDGVAVRATMEELLQGTDPSEPILLLQHEPSDLDMIGDQGVDLSVSGHTHDGQIFPGNIFCRIKGPQSYGLKEWGSAKAIVTSGVGFYGPPIRVATISEIAVIDFK